MSKGKLPKGWKVLKFKDVTTIIGGGTPSTSIEEYYDGDIPWLSPVDLSGYKKKYISKGRKNITKLGLQKSSARLLPKNSVLFSSRAPIGYVAIAENEVTTNQGFKNLLPSPIYDPSFAYYYLKFKKDYIESQASGTTFKEISGKKLGEIEFVLPPLPEQQRIVARLDAIFGHLDVLKEKLDRIPELLKNFRQQVLTQAVTGELTREWREGNGYFMEESLNLEEDLEMREIKYGIPESWLWVPFNSIAEVKSNLVQPNEYLDYPLIAPDNIESGSGKLINTPLVSDILPKSPKHFFHEGNIVYSKIRPYLSKLILADFEGLCSADMYPISTSLVTKYLYYFMLSDVFLRYATTAGERSVLPKINQKELAVIPISVPPLNEQEEIVRQVDSLFCLADKIESQYRSLKAKIDQLPQAILAKAFRGELVAQEVKKYVREVEELGMVAEED